jgi:hypothetical protein
LWSRHKRSGEVFKEMKLDGLIIHKEYLDKILSGKKTWEMRGSRCLKRGKIALIESGSGTVVGTAEVINCIGPLSLAHYNAGRNRHQGDKLNSLSDQRYKTPYAWVLKSAKRLREPVKYKHKTGVIIWHPVKL